MYMPKLFAVCGLPLFATYSHDSCYYKVSGARKGGTSSFLPTHTMSKRQCTCALLMAAIGLGLSGSLFAAPVTVPNGDFSNAANNGSVGGGIAGGSGSMLIGSGPWAGTYSGVLGPLIPPTLTISPGQATISNLAVALLGINNSGDFNQVLAAAYVPVKHYVLAADVSAGNSILGLSALASGNIGVALTSGNTTLSSTQNSSQISFTVAGHNLYHVALGYDTTASDSGGIGVELFADPTGVLAVNLQSSVTFSNAVLTEAPVPALPPSLIEPASGTPQAASVNTAFSAPFVVSVVDAQGDPLQGILVTFTVPSSGASVVLSSPTAMTDVGGRATVTGLANGTAGRYTIMAGVSSLQQTAVFDLTNSAVGQPPVTGLGGGNNGQVATVGSIFECKLAVKVINGSAPAAGATVVFAAPIVGPSADLSDGTMSGPILAETTNASGIAAVSASANPTAGSYNVTATATALISGPLVTPVLLVTYPMTNLAVGERIFANGFEEVPALCGF